MRRRTPANGAGALVADRISGANRVNAITSPEAETAGLCSSACLLPILCGAHSVLAVVRQGLPLPSIRCASSALLL